MMRQPLIRFHFIEGIRNGETKRMITDKLQSIKLKMNIQSSKTSNQAMRLIFAFQPAAESLTLTDIAVIHWQKPVKREATRMVLVSPINREQKIVSNC